MAAELRQCDNCGLLNYPSLSKCIACFNSITAKVKEISALEQSSFIFNGFIHKIESLLSFKNDFHQIIPQSIIDLISIFTGNIFDNHESFTWEITDRSVINK